MISGLKRITDCQICGQVVKESIHIHCWDCREKIYALTRARKDDAKIAPSYCYAVGIKDDDKSLIKFGFTVSPESRLGNLQTGSPATLEYLAVCKGRRSHERTIHRHLMGDREFGEWFRRSERAIAVVEAMRADKLAEYLVGYGPDSLIIKYLQSQNP